MSRPVSSAGLRAERWVRFDSVDASAFDLARYWAERVLWPEHGRKLDDLHELAVQSRLADWCWRWQPILIHRAVLDGATAGEVAAACGTGIATVEARWRRWTEGQRRLAESTSGRVQGPGRLDVARVAAVLVEPEARR